MNRDAIGSADMKTKISTTAPLNNAGALPMQDAAMDVLRQFRVIFGSARQHFREVEEHCGISSSQIWMLTESKRSPGIGVTELAARLGIRQSTGSILVEKLVSRGLLIKERSREDQRRVGLHPSAEGELVLAKLPGPAEGVLPAALNTLPEVVLKTLIINLDELISKLRVCEKQYAATPLADIMGEQTGRALNRE